MRSALGTLTGIVLLLVGLSILINVLFGVSIPIFRLLLAGLAIYFGLLLLLGVFKIRVPGIGSVDGTIAFAGGDLKLTGDPIEARELTVALARGTVDISALPVPQEGELPVRLSVVLGECTVLYDPAQPLRIDAATAFGDCKMPNDEKVVVGSLAWKSPAYDAVAPRIKLSITCVLGQVRFVAKSGVEERENTPRALSN